MLSGVDVEEKASTAPAESILRLPPNLFSIAFGLSGLAQCWRLAHHSAGIPPWPADLLWIVALLVWLSTVISYGRSVVATGRVRTELADPVFAPFIALAFIVPTVISVGIGGHDRMLGRAVFLVGLVLTIGIGGWLMGQWMASDLALASWHPGYLLPSVAGGLVAAASAAAMGYHALAEILFGYGIVSWLSVGTVVLVRLFTGPALPAPLVPTLAIELAPPVVAGNAWFEINGNRPDALALALAGYAILMVTVQLRLIPLYRRVPFGPGWWAFSFSYSAAFVFAIRWLVVEHVQRQQQWIYVLLFVVTLAFAALTVRTGWAIARGSFLPRGSRPTAAGSLHP